LLFIFSVQSYLGLEIHEGQVLIFVYIILVRSFFIKGFSNGDKDEGDLQRAEDNLPDVW
jgi:hypothetical protein